MYSTALINELLGPPSVWHMVPFRLKDIFQLQSVQVQFCEAGSLEIIVCIDMA